LSSTTPNLGLRKPDTTDFVDVTADIAHNMDLIDSQVLTAGQHATLNHVGAKVVDGSFDLWYSPGGNYINNGPGRRMVPIALTASTGFTTTVTTVLKAGTYVSASFGLWTPNPGPGWPYASNIAGSYELNQISFAIALMADATGAIPSGGIPDPWTMSAFGAQSWDGASFWDLLDNAHDPDFGPFVYQSDSGPPAKSWVEVTVDGFYGLHFSALIGEASLYG
jgi:hypothetical protein